MMKNFTKLVLLFAFSVFATGAMAQIVYVNEANGAAPIKDGTSWANAYDNLQSALDDATLVAGNQIWVAKGTYKPSTVPIGLTISSGSVDKTFLIPEGVELYGGFVGNEVGVSGAAVVRDFAANETILNGDLNGDDDGGDLLKKVDNALHVVTIVAHGAPTFVMDGFTVENGYASGASLTKINTSNYYSFYGGGIFLREAGGVFRHMIVKNNIVNANTASSVAYAGGVFIAGTKNVNLENVSFIGNKSLNEGASSAYAGALYLAVPLPVLSNIIFDGNEAKTYGGAVSIGSGNTTFKNVQLFNNISLSNGGAVYITAATSQATFVNSIFYNNEARALSAGGALYIANGTVNLINNTVYNNKATTTASANGGAVYINNLVTAILNVDNSIFLDNTALGASKDIAKGASGVLNITHSLTQGATGTNVVTDAIEADVFKSVSPLDADFLKLKPLTGNPAIDAGDNSKIPAGVTIDLAGAARVHNITVDLGAYENLTVLPITLSRFTAKAQGNGIQLNWITVNETNNSHFLLAHSTDGINFMQIAKVATKGNGASYSHTDFSPASGVNYYSLTQVDNDGTLVNYDPISVNFLLKAQAEVNLYPNPATGSRITVSLAGQKFNTLQVVNLNGQRMLLEKVNATDLEKTVDISNYPSSTYFIRLTDGTKVVTKKFLKP